MHLDQLDKFRDDSEPSLEEQDYDDEQAIPEIEIEQTLITSSDDSPKKSVLNVQAVPT